VRQLHDLKDYRDNRDSKDNKDNKKGNKYLKDKKCWLLLAPVFSLETSHRFPSPSFAVGFGGQARRGRDREGAAAATPLPAAPLPASPLREEESLREGVTAFCRGTPCGCPLEERYPSRGAALKPAPAGQRARW